MPQSEVTMEMLEKWAVSTELFAFECFGFVADAWQKEVFAAWDNPDLRRIAMQACTGPGKTAAMAICGWHSLTFQAAEGMHPNGYAVSITAANLKDNLWKELAVLYQRSTFLQKYFDFKAEEIVNRQFPKTWWLRMRSFAQKADQEAQGRTLSGLHAPFIFYLIDEAGDMPPAVSRTAEQGLGKGEEWGKILMSGNPTSLEGALHNAAVLQAGRYHVIRITGDPDDPKRSPRIDIENARELIALYGRDDPWVMATILGKFPPTSLNSLFSADDLRDAMQRPVLEHMYDFSQKRLGIDVARFGDDKTVIYPRQGIRLFKKIEMRGAKTHEIAARVISAKNKWRSEMEFIDDTGGWAAGVTDACELGNVVLTPVNFSSTQTNDPRYYNRRSEIYFMFAQWVKDGGVMPFDPAIIPQLTAVKYFYQGGKFRIIEKDQIKKDLHGVSPDDADAAALTFSIPDMPAEMESVPGLPTAMMDQIRSGASAGREAVKDWNPYND